MNYTLFRAWSLWSAVCLLLCATLCHAAEQQLTIRDYTGRGFPPDLVRYALPPQADGNAVRVYDANGTALPCQVDGARESRTLSFVAEVGPNETAAYTVRNDGKGPAPAGAVRMTRDGDTLVLENALLAIRVPAMVNKTFPAPVDAATLPPPILAFRSGQGAWMGSAKVLTTRKVKAFTVAVTPGPVCAEARYEIQWAEGGYYRARIQVIDRVPVVQFREEFDLGKLDGGDWWELNLANGWAPDQMELGNTWGNGTLMDMGRNLPLADLAKKPVQYFGSEGKIGTLGLWVDAERKANPAAFTMAGVIAMHKGDWRHMNVAEIRSTGPQDIRVAFPMTTRTPDWRKDSGSETSPFSMHEYDPGVPPTYGRRVWGLVLAAPALRNRDAAVITFGMNYHGMSKIDRIQTFTLARALYGVVGLDRYKDFTLEWPEGKVAYPRLYMDAATLDARRKALEASPLPADVKQLLLAKSFALSGDPAAATANLAALEKSYLNWFTNYAISNPTISHHAVSDMYLGAALADDVLAWPGLDPAKRREIRAKLALCAYLYLDEDVMSYGSGEHTGNPNMGTARIMSSADYVALLPDHPAYAAWREDVLRRITYKLGTQMAPGGGWFEYGASYHMHGFARATNAFAGLEALQMPNLQTIYSAYYQPDWNYFMNLLTPVDSRWQARMIPGMANSSPGNVTHFMEAAGSFAKIDPAFAANLLWAWQANGATPGYNTSLTAATIAPKEPELKSSLFPGFGVIFRAHQGPDETYMLLRSGYLWSHWYIDPGNFIMMSRGATLMPFQPYQYNYASKTPGFDLYNTVRLGSPKNQWPYGWPDSNILDYAFGASVDYAWSSTGFPDWFITPGAAPGWGEPRELAEGAAQQPGAVVWDRQVLFLKGATAKSPNYFAFRDTFNGEGKLASNLYLNVLGTKDDIKVNGDRILVNTEWPVKLDVAFTRPVTPDLAEERLPIASHDARAKREVPTTPNWVMDNGAAPKPGTAGTHERHTLLRIPGQPGADFTWLLYPRDEKEPAPAVKALAPGAVQVTHPEGTDYIFLSSGPMTYAGNEVVFTGATGAVRIGKDAVTLALTGGTGRIGYKGYVVSGAAPFERTIPLDKLKKGEDAVAPARFAIALPAALADQKTLAPGVSKTVAGDATVYRVENAAFTRFTEGNVTLEAQAAQVEISPKGVRFIVPTNSYAKLVVGNIGIRGEGPFDLTFTADGIAGTVDGRLRTLVTTWPEKLTRPMYHLDDLNYYAGFADDPTIRKGTATPQFALAFAVSAGQHQVKVHEWVFPPLPAAPARRAVAL